ncbi:MAG TPA: DUF4339 domain-containing protein [Bacteroidia bacterium]|nr:DUF4339 domain-containing protein [Bacteroidia bacterium]
MSNWHYSLEGRKAGPSPLSELEELVRQGRVKPDAPVWTDGMADWLPLSQALPELAASVAGQPEPGTPPPFPVSSPPPMSATPAPVAPPAGTTPRKKSAVGLVLGVVALLVLIGLALNYGPAVSGYMKASRKISDVTKVRSLPVGYFPKKAGHRFISAVGDNGYGPAANPKQNLWPSAFVFYKRPGAFMPESSQSISIEVMPDAETAALWLRGDAQKSEVETYTLLGTTPQGNLLVDDPNRDYPMYQFRWIKGSHGFWYQLHPSEVPDGTGTISVPDFVTDYQRAANVAP